MELAIGIGLKGTLLTGYVLNCGEEMVSMPLKDLYRRGLPTVDKSSRRRIDTDFADWRQVDAQEYLKAFGFQLPDGIQNNQQFFETEIGNRRYVIPVLALMRALFRPTKHLLPTMFMPQALDQVCWLNSSAESFSVSVDASWATEGLAVRHSDWKALLGWMVAHPTATEMAGSVHHQAIRGHIGMRLPSARIRVVMRGLEVSRTTFVTEAAISTITPIDDPLFKISGLTGIVALHDRVLQKGGTAPELAKRYKVPLNAEGSSKLSNDEWIKIELLMNHGRKRLRPFKLSQREILDGVLYKLATGTPWKQVNYEIGNWQNASAAFQSWSTRGTMDLIIQSLNNTRTAPSKASSVI